MSIGRQDYQERKDARADRLEERAQAAAQKSDDAFRRSSSLVSGIPAGQPILPGARGAHHRRTLERSWNLMERGVQSSRKADYLQGRADAIRENSAISSDDPEALEKLEQKLAALQAAQERDKAMNAYYRKHKTVKGFDGVSDERAEKIDASLAELREALRRPVPSFRLSNRNAEINRLKKRIEQLRAVDSMEHIEIPFDGGVLVTNEDINRVQIIFDTRADDETRAKLKSSGFRWAPSEGAWQTRRTPAALARAKWLLGITEKEEIEGAYREIDE